MIDSTLVGGTAAKCMEYMDNHEDLDGGEIISCALIVVAQDKGKNVSFTRTFCSDEVHYMQVGIMAVGMDCVTGGRKADDNNGEEYPDDSDDDV